MVLLSFTKKAGIWSCPAVKEFLIKAIAAEIAASEI
jgi:hypothetical protein